MITALLIAATGLLSGLLSGLLGIGGGVIMVPLFYYLLGMEMAHAVGTSLAIIVITALAGSLTHWNLGHVHLKIVLATALFAILGSVAGAALTAHLNPTFLKKLLGIVLISVAFKLLIER